MKILITGAHFSPAVAVIEELKKVGVIEIVYVGRENTLEGDSSPSVESELLPFLGIKFVPITTGRLQRALTIYTIPSLLKIPIGLLQALFIILTEKPDVVLSFGGYVAVPIVVVSWLFSIPIIIHEQSLTAGLANRISSYFADKIAVSFKTDTLKGEKVILTGNPLRREIIGAAQSVRSTHPLILIIGGNQGSHVINLVVEQCLSKLTKLASIIHQTGDSKFGDYERLKQKENVSYKVEKFIDEEWAKALSSCDLVISRAGINTLTELAYLGKPGLVIPIEGHPEQNINAKFFASHSLVKILPQSKLSADSLLKNIRFMLNNLQHFKEKAQNIKDIVTPDAAKRLALETILLAK